MKHLLLLSFVTFIQLSCSSSSTDTPPTKTNSDGTVKKVAKENFMTNDALTITEVDCTLSNGTKTRCLRIVSNSTPSDHTMGPWCPSTINDDKSKGGIWLKDGTVHDVDGAFIKNLATLYGDNKWQMYNAITGNVIKMATKTDCEAAGNPNVGEQYQNHCVECLPSYITDVSQTYLIPITPVILDTPLLFTSTQGGGPGGPGGGPPGGGSPGSPIPTTRGVALNGVEFSAPAPVSNILAAYTIAPFDDAGGHINVHQGYHYHTTTGMSKKVNQDDVHSALIGYAMDGFGIYELKNEKGEMPTDLDNLRGHTDSVRGYHYHVDASGNNNFINGLKGAYAVQ